MKNHVYHIIFIISLFMLSCTPGKEISFDVLQAAEFEFPEEVDSLLVLNLAYYPWVDTLDINLLNRIRKSEQYIIDTLVISSIFNGFFSIIDYSLIKELTENQYYEIRGDSLDNFLEALNIESVNYLCNEFNTSQIISLEYYGLNLSIDRYESSNYKAITRLDMERILRWRIYQPDVGMIFKDFSKDTLIWYGIGADFIESDNNLPALVDIIREAYWYGGESFAKKMSPYWKEVKRTYFKLKKTLNTDGSLDEDFLKLLTSSNNKLLRFKTFFNLAVVYEKDGNYEKAIEALGEAEKLKPKSEIVESYKIKLKESLKRKERVLKQIE